MRPSPLTPDAAATIHQGDAGIRIDRAHQRPEVLGVDLALKPERDGAAGRPLDRCLAAARVVGAVARRHLASVVGLLA